MAYVSDSNLTQFWGLAKDYIKAENSRYANWQKTEKAGAVTCWPVGGTELLPTVDFLFTETGPAEGTKAPDNPSTITGVSSITVTRCETAGVDETQYTVDLGSTYYGGALDLATGVMTVTWERVLEWTLYYISTSFSETQIEVRQGLPSVTAARNANRDKILCNMLNYDVSSPRIYANSFRVYGANRNIVSLVLEKSNFPSVSSSSSTNEWKEAVISWLTSNIVMIYQRETPYTVQLTPTHLLSLTQADKYTPRLNTVYTDASAVQVGYVKSPIRSEYELTQAIIATEGGE